MFTSPGSEQTYYFMNWSNLSDTIILFFEPFYLFTSGLVLVLVLLLLALLRRQPKHLIAYETEDGSVTVSRLAIVELVRTSCNQFSELGKPSIRIHKRGKYTHLTIYIKFLGGSRLREIEKTLQEHLRHNLSESLGVENLGKINIVVTSFKSKKIAPPSNVSEKNTLLEINSEKVEPKISEIDLKKSTQEP